VIGPLDEIRQDKGQWLFQVGIGFLGAATPPLSLWRKWLFMQHHIEPPMARGLVLLRHRLAAAQIEKNRLRLAGIMAAPASLPHVVPLENQSGPGQAETPEASTSEASYTSSLLRRPSWLRTA